MEANKSALKIAFTGPSCSGKSTLARELYLVLSSDYECKLIEEVFERICKSLQYSIPQLQKDPHLMYAIQYLAIVEQKRIEEYELQRNDIVIVDRTIQDSYVYAKNFLDSGLYKQIPLLESKYDLIIYCEPFEFKENDFRANYRVQGEIEWFEKEIKPNANVILPVIPYYERLRIVLSEVSKLL